MSNELEYSADKFGRSSIKMKLFSENSVEEDVFKNILNYVLYNLGEDCLKKEGTVIGHIKAYLKASTGFLKADLVSLKSGIEIEGKLTGSVKEAELALAAIVFGLKDEDVRSYIRHRIRVARDRFTVEFVPEFPHPHSH